MSEVRAGRRDPLLAGTIFFLVSLAFAISWGWDIADDSWLLQVAARFARGDVLYRDVYLPVTPLSIYLIALPTRILGAQMLTLKIETALAFAGLVLISLRINNQLGAEKRYPALMIIALFALASTGRMALLPFYSHLASFFLFAAFTTWLSWRQSGDIRWMYLCGALMGACFVTKQNTGAYAVTALLVSEIARGTAQRERLSTTMGNLVRVGLAFAIVVAIVLAPVVFTGGWSYLIAEGLIGRGLYLYYAGVQYMKPIYDLREMVIGPPGFKTLKFVNAALPFLLPFVIAPLLLLLCARDKGQARALHIAVAAFSAAALAVVYPRADQWHMIFAVPMLLVAFAYCWRHLSASIGLRRQRVLRYAAFATATGILAFMCVSAVRRALPSEGQLSTIPHFRGLIYPRYLHVPLKGNVEHVGAFEGKKMFYLGPQASFYYLAGELKNPTRYDYPTIISLGPAGTIDVIARIMDGRIERVCLGGGDDPLLEARALKEWIRKNMTRLPQPEFCEQYARRTGVQQ